MGIQHFRNGLLCQKHLHGATCAVDALLDTYFYSIYNIDRRVYNVNNMLLNKLTQACENRQLGRVPECLQREDVWNWCVANLPTAFAPKGTQAAEILASFLAFSEGSGKKFVSSCYNRYHCQHCQIYTVKALNDQKICLSDLFIKYNKN